MKRALLLATLAGCPARAPVSFAEPPADGAEVTDPVSRDRCKKDPTTQSSILDERTYYFCSAETAARFRSDPSKHADR